MENVVFDKCREIAHQLNEGDEISAREKLIRLLDYLSKNKIAKDALVNHLIRAAGLFPYLDNNATWRDALVGSMFQVDVGGKKNVVLHREQSKVLKELLSGKSVVVNAPTSFGKSFVIDALIAIKKPKNIVIIVPTLALTDETRRRLFKKFSNEYRIVSTTDEELGDRNILIFPQERVSYYFKRISKLDLLIVDEFYKADSKYDAERSGALINVLAELKHRASQCYFLMPNIDGVNDNLFTKGMIHIPTKFQTVVLDRHPLYAKISKGSVPKKRALQKLTNELRSAKSLVYAKAPSEVRKVACYMRAVLPVCHSNSQMQEFATWVSDNYDAKWDFVEDIRHGVVQHNGAFHRSLAQLCVKAFDQYEECHYLVATSSLIEGVNTCAENVILWSNKKGHADNLDPFSFKNIMGRSGRMLKYFVGHVYELAKPPEIVTQDLLDLKVDSDDLFEYEDEEKQQYLTDEQIKAIKSQKIELYNEFGKDFCRQVFRNYTLNTLKLDQVRQFHKYFIEHNDGGIFSLMQSDDIRDWGEAINVILLVIYPENNPYQKMLRKNMATYIYSAVNADWRSPLKAVLSELAQQKISVDTYFKLERDTSFKVASCLQDINVIAQAMGMTFDLTCLVKRISNAFLPPRVYDLEEYGLPRMLSRKIHEANVINLESTESLATCVKNFQSIGKEALLRSVPTFDSFDRKIIDSFYDGITCG